jgi:hypothetical protein
MDHLGAFAAVAPREIGMRPDDEAVPGTRRLTPEGYSPAIVDPALEPAQTSLRGESPVTLPEETQGPRTGRTQNA